MNKTIITLNVNGEPQKVELLFGMWTLFRLKDFGFDLKDFDKLNSDPLRAMEIIIVLMYLAACNANGQDLSAYDKGLFYEYAESNGGLAFANSDEVKKVMTCFTNSISVPSSKGEKKSTPDKQKK